MRNSVFLDWNLLDFGIIRNCIAVGMTGWTLIHQGRATLMYVGNLTIIVADNGLSPDRRQAIIWTNAGILLIGPLTKTSRQS